MDLLLQVVALRDHRIGIRRSKLVDEVLDCIVLEQIGVAGDLLHPLHRGFEVVILAVAVAVPHYRLGARNRALRVAAN